MSYGDRDGVLLVNSAGEIVGPMVRHEYNYNRDDASVATGLKCEDVSRARQEFAEESDINTIVERFGLTGELPAEPVSVPISVDYTEVVTDYRTALDMVIQADKAFMALPAKTRERFGNDPQQLMLFVQDKENLDEARKLGIAVPAPVAPAPPEPMPVRIVEQKTS